MLCRPGCHYFGGEIYSAVRFDFNMPAAAGLSLIQFALTALVVGVGAACGGMMAPALITSQMTIADRFDLSRSDRLVDWLSITLAALLIILPVGLIVLNGMNAGLLKLISRPQFWDTLVTALIFRDHRSNCCDAGAGGSKAD